MTMNVVQLVSNRVWGGGERYVLDLCKALRDNGHSVAVITRGKKEVNSRFIEAGFNPGRLPLRGRFDFISPVVLARVLNRIEAPVVVHAHNFKDADTAVRARRLMSDPSKVRIVVTRHLIKPASTGAYARELYGAIDDIIFVSDAARQGFLSSKPAVDASKLHVVHNALTPDSAPAPMPRKDAEIRVAFAGRINPEKGLDTLFQAISDVPGVNLYIAGSGQARYVGTLLRLAARLGIADRVEWLGQLPDVRPLFESADIGVVPSVVAESFSLAALEMLQAGLPVVASATGGLCEVLEDGSSAILVPPGNAPALAEAISRLAADKALRAEMAAAARKRAELFSYDRFYDAITDIYTANGR